MSSNESRATEATEPACPNDPKERSAGSKLSAAAPGWLEDSIVKLREIDAELNSASSSDEVMRRAVEAGRSKLGFNRLSVWLFEPGERSLTGTFGVNVSGEVVDERHCRVFDHGSIAPQREAWGKAPYYFLRLEDTLRDSEGGVIARGVHITAPIVNGSETKGFLTVDDLLESSAINEKTGLLLGLFASAISGAYYTKIAESEARDAVAASERADAIKREFLGMLSHEVRTPLNAILGFAQLLCLDSDSEEHAQLAMTIEQSGDHLLNLLSSMMDYANLADADLSKRFAPCKPVQIARETVDSFTEIAGKKGLRVSFVHEGEFDGSVLADAISLRQVLSNLVQNAIKFTQSGSVSVVVQTQPKPNGAMAVLLSVEDTGCGIEKKDLKTIFEPFKQLDSSLTRAHGGIGMGLAIVDRLVASMGGRIICDSTVGTGTRFTVDFHFEPVSAVPKVALHHHGTRVASHKARSALKILIAEDNETNRLLLLNVLNRLGYSEPDQAVDGAAAAELVAQRPYDLLILDLQMPKIDGVSLTRLVREGKCGPINADVPIIGLTAHNFTYDHDRSRAAGMNDYLTKPFKAEQLRDAIEQLALL